MNKQIKYITTMAVMITLAMVFSYVDSIIVLPFGIPGIKLGIANIAIIYALYKLGIKEAIIISSLRLILSSILFGTVLTFAYSLAGAVLSLILMIILKKFAKLAIITVSIVGAVMHNTAQIIMAIILMDTSEIIYYLPVLIITGIISGVGVGILASVTLNYTKNIKFN